MLSGLRKKVFNWTNPRDMVELTAPLTFVQLISGQLPYTIIRSPKTNKYECQTSSAGICLFIGYILFYIVSLATYKQDIGEGLLTGITKESYLIRFALWTAFTICNFIVILLGKDTLRVYVSVLNNINVVYGEPQHRPYWRRTYRTIQAVTSGFLLHFAMTYYIAYYGILNSFKNSTNSTLHIIFVYVMPNFYLRLTILQIVKSMCLIHWHFSYINEALNGVYRQEKEK